jgi:MoaA/NifB/PqqE/SkfB family radical SAM enzyme
MDIWWGLTNNCNLQCFYCSKHHKEEYYSYDMIGQYVVNIINKLAKYKKIVLYLFGGEPTLYPYLLNILNDIYSDIYVDLQTNLIIDPQVLIKYIETQKISKISGSLHYGVCDTTIFHKNIQNLLKYNLSIKLYLMYDSKYEDLFLKDYKKYNNLKKYYEKLECVGRLIFDNNNDYYSIPSSQQLLDIIYKKEKKYNIYDNLTFHEIKNQKLNKFTNMCCEAVKENLYIDSDGSIYACQTYYRYLKKKFGHVKDSNIIDKILQTQYIVCEADYCDCEIGLKKYENKNSISK